MSGLSHVHVHSHDRQDTVNRAEDFALDVPHYLKRPLAKVALRSAVIPNQCYNVPAGRNTFSITEIAGASLTFTVASGYYSRDALILALNASVPVVTLGVQVGATYVWAYDAVSDRITYSVKDAVPAFISYMIDADPSTLNFLKLFGFTYQIGALPAALLTANRGPMMVPHKYIYVCMDDVNSGICVGSNSVVQSQLNTVVFPLPISVPYGDLIVYENVNPIFVSYGNSERGSVPSKLRFTLRDSTGAVYDNNGAEWSATFEFVYA